MHYDIYQLAITLQCCFLSAVRPSRGLLPGSSSSAGLRMSTGAQLISTTHFCRFGCLLVQPPAVAYLYCSCVLFLLVPVTPHQTPLATHLLLRLPETSTNRSVVHSESVQRCQTVSRQPPSAPRPSFATSCPHTRALLLRLVALPISPSRVRPRVPGFQRIRKCSQARYFSRRASTIVGVSPSL